MSLTIPPSTFFPVPVVMKAGCFVFSSYRSGILTDDDDCFCESRQCIDHAVVVIGYKDDVPTPYWILRNSWSKSWGEKGMFRVAQAQETGGRFGLFAILAEAAIPLQAYNTTSAEPSDDLETWKIVVIVIAAVLLCCCCAVALKLFA